MVTFQSCLPTNLTKCEDLLAEEDARIPTDFGYLVTSWLSWLKLVSVG